MSRLMRNKSGNGEIRLEMIISKIKEEREIEREEKTDTSHRVKKRSTYFGFSNVSFLCLLKRCRNSKDLKHKGKLLSVTFFFTLSFPTAMEQRA